jgi:hypothetical protein
VTIYKVSYRSAVNGRAAAFVTKVPYGEVYHLSELLTRLVAKGQVVWFRMQAATAQDIALHRAELARWPDGMRATLPVTQVNQEV